MAAMDRRHPIEMAATVAVGAVTATEVPAVGVAAEMAAAMEMGGTISNVHPTKF